MLILLMLLPPLLLPWLLSCAYTAVDFAYKNSHGTRKGKPVKFNTQNFFLKEAASGNSSYERIVPVSSGCSYKRSPPTVQRLLYN